MNTTKKVFTLVQISGKGFGSLRKLFSSGESSPAIYREVWGFQPLLLLLPLLAVCLAGPILLFSHSGTQWRPLPDPFTMSFPSQIVPTIFALALSPLTLFAVSSGLWIKKRLGNGFLAEADGEEIFMALGRPLLLAGAILVLLYEGYRFFATERDATNLISLIHGTSHALFTGAWLSFFIAASLAKKGLGLKKIFGGFIAYHAILFAHSLIPNFGVLHFVAKALLHPNYDQFGLMATVASLVKAVICLGVIMVFILVIHKRVLNVHNGLTNIQNEPWVPPLPKEATAKQPVSHPQ